VFTSRLFRNRGYWLLLLFWALLISYSRIYSGVHYPLDLIGGALLGWIIGVGMYKLMMFIENHFFVALRPKLETTDLKPQQAGLIFLVFVILSTTVVISTYLLHHYNYL
jgi:undecaprenyl-diphosphatase